VKNRWLPFLALMPLAVAAQDAAVQRQLMLRQQQSDAFTLQLRQSLERQQLPPSDLGRQQQLDSQQTSERNRLDNVSQQQLLEVKPNPPRNRRPYERQKAADERRPLTVPVGGIVKPD
jgi:hypothetical protein